MKTTKKDMKLFTQECNKWIEYFSLGDWDVDFFHDVLDGPIAQTQGNWQQKHASIILNLYLDDDYHNDEQLRKIAFHEVCELLLMEMRILAMSRFLSSEDINNATHSVIQRLVNSIYKGRK